MFGMSDFSSASPKRVLIFTRMEDYVHGSTPAQASWVRNACRDMGWEGIVTDDHSLLEKPSTEVFDLIVFANNSGQILDPNNEILTQHIAEGRGVMGIHAALACFLNGEDASGETIMAPTTDIFEKIFKAHFKNHPPVQSGKVMVDKKVAAEIGLDDLPYQFVHTDEFFNFTSNPCDEGEVTVVAYADESSYSGGLMGEKHPLVWYHTVGERKAPVFYCALGHFSHFYNGLGPKYIDKILRAGLKYCCPP